MDAHKEESRREFDERQRNNYESLKTDEVLTLKESASIDHGKQHAKQMQQPIIAAQAMPMQQGAMPQQGKGDPKGHFCQSFSGIISVNE